MNTNVKMNVLLNTYDLGGRKNTIAYKRAIQHEFPNASVTYGESVPATIEWDDEISSDEKEAIQLRVDMIFQELEREGKVTCQAM